MTTIKEDFVSFETAKLLKEKGFDENCAALYDLRNGEFREKQTGYVFNNSQWENFITAPTLQMTMKWLREKHLLHISIEMMNGGRWEYEIDDISVPFDGGVIPKYCCDKTFSNYEKAADDAIKHCLKNLI